MKTKHQNHFSVLHLFFAFLVLTFLLSCKTKDNSTPTPTATNGTLEFHLHTNADTSEVGNYGDTLTMSDGRKIVVDMAQLYISHIQLVKLDGSTLDVPGKIIFKKQEIEPCLVGSVPAGNYKSVKFYVGLDASTNSSTPASSDSTLNQPSMWFNSLGAQPWGFVYVNFQGKIDTATVPSSSHPLIPFSYKLGTPTAYKQITMPDKNFTVTPNQVQFVHMIIDYNMLFMGIMLNNSANLNVTTTAQNNTSLGQQLGNNIGMMFSYEM